MSNAANQTSNININVPRRPPPLYHVQLVVLRKVGELLTLSVGRPQHSIVAPKCSSKCALKRHTRYMGARHIERGAFERIRAIGEKYTRWRPVMNRRPGYHKLKRKKLRDNFRIHSKALPVSLGAYGRTTYRIGKPSNDYGRENVAGH